MSAAPTPQPVPRPAPDREEIVRSLAVLLAPGQVAELRALDVATEQYRRSHVVSGYYDDVEKLATAAAKVSPVARGVYLIANPIDPILLSRSANRCRNVGGNDSLTSDSDVQRYRWLIVDADPVRPSGVSSSDEEHALAIARVREIRDWLAEQAWPAPIVADSGNGAHLLYRLDLPADGGRILKRVLEGLACRFDDERVHVDQAPWNPSRGVKLYGTIARKGDHTPSRPHRVARLLEVPLPGRAVSDEELAAIAKLAPEPPPEPKRRGRIAPPREEWDADRWLAEHLPDAKPPKPWKGGRLWVLPRCPFNEQHQNTAHVVEWPNGALAAGCFKSSCAHWGWRELRELLEPGCYDRPIAPAYAAASPPANGASANGYAKGALEETVQLSEAELASAVDTFKHTDVGNAERLVARHGRDLHYCYDWGRWLVWDGRRWRKDASGEVYRRAKETIRNLYKLAADELDSDRRKMLVEHAHKTEKTYSRVSAMVNAAQSEPGIAVAPDRLDVDPWLFNCENGTLDLRTGQLRPHDRADLLSKLAPVAYIPRGICPRWTSFLERILPDPDVRRYLQKCVGYWLTGSRQVQELWFFHGGGSNGKSTLLNTLLEMMGEYGKQAAPNLLVVDNHDRHPTELADLMGARFIASIEVEEGKRLAEALVKQMTGGDKIKARYVRQDFFEFWPTHKIVVAANHKPRVRGTDYAIWRRIRLIPFTVTIGEDEKDETLPEKLRAELPGILAWAIEGCLAWQREGLAPPTSIVEATREYRDEEDVFSQFLTEVCVQDPQAQVKAQLLYRHYCDWCGENGERPLTQHSVGRRLTQMCFDRRQLYTEKHWYWLGLGLASPETDESPGPSGPSGPFFRDNQKSFPHEASIGKKGSGGSGGSGTDLFGEPIGGGRKPVETDVDDPEDWGEV